MAYSLNPSSADCYEGTTCLVNKLDIRDEKRLSEIESQITFAKAALLEQNDVNYIHPFREGNGRAQRIYFAQLIRHYGYDINFSDVDADELMIATIQASQGVLDFLIEFFESSIIV